MGEENNTDDIFFKNYWWMWNRACYKVHSMLIDCMESLKWKQLWNTWKAGKIIAFDSITQAITQWKYATARQSVAKEKNNQNKLTKHFLWTTMGNLVQRDYSITLLILFCSHSQVLWLFCHSQSHGILTSNHGPTCGYHRPSPNLSYNLDLNSQYTALKTLFPTMKTHEYFFYVSVILVI